MDHRAAVNEMGPLLNWCRPSSTTLDAYLGNQLIVLAFNPFAYLYRLIQNLQDNTTTDSRSEEFPQLSCKTCVAPGSRRGVPARLQRADAAAAARDRGQLARLLLLPQGHVRHALT